MLTKISHITLFVHNQDETLNFYQKIGFVVHTDALFGESRWLTISLPQQKELEIAVIKADTEQEKELVGRQGLAKPFLSLESNDCYADYEAFKKLAIDMLDKPTEQPWGISFSMKDLYGNIIYICEPA